MIYCSDLQADSENLYLPTNKMLTFSWDMEQFIL